MKVLVVGSGGREHALAWKLRQSPRVSTVHVAPGNAGTECEPGVENVDIGAENATGLVDFASNAGVDLTVVGPEVPLTLGVVDAFMAAGLRCLGPSRVAAELEGSKTFAKAFLARHAIPTAAHRSFDQLNEARDYIHAHGVPVVIKADGLAAGKGVTLAATMDEALQAAETMLGGEVFGGAGERIVVEDWLHGEEASFIALVDGENILPLASSQDHKARNDGDTGPNTGGMGAYSPAPVVDATVHQRILEQIIRPTIRGLAAEGRLYTGFLYAGLMIDDHGMPRVLEFNVRLGDPETQPLLMRLRSDFADLCDAALDGRLDAASVDWDERPCLGVVMTAGGYPGAYGKGDPISGLAGEVDSGDMKVFHAGTAFDDAERVVTMGGRVLCVCALGEDIAAAQRRAYKRVDAIHWNGAYWRRDIGHRAIDRE